MPSLFTWNLFAVNEKGNSRRMAGIPLVQKQSILCQRLYASNALSGLALEIRKVEVRHDFAELITDLPFLFAEAGL